MEEITPKQSGVRLDKWLAESYPEKSRTFWQKKITEGKVRTNRKTVSSNYVLHKDDVIQIQALNEPIARLKGESLSLRIYFEDKNYAVIEKPAGLVVHPGAGNPESTLVHGLLHHFKKNLSHLETDRPGIVHRLDKETSGLLIIAKNDTTHQKLAKQFETKEIKKTYYALVKGHINPQRGTIEAPVARDTHQRKRITVTGKSGAKEAITHYQVQKKFAHPLEASLLEIQIETGRTHQIRVHLSAIDHPVLGDTTYGNRGANQILEPLDLKRQFLHAHKLGFTSPTTGKHVEYTSELPEDLSRVITHFS